MRRRSKCGPRGQAGFTLIELVIAITLVAAISAGLLTAMRNGLLTMDRTQRRLEENRKALGIQDLIRRQIGGAMPVRGYCGSGRAVTTMDIFRGNASTLLLVSNESMTEGSRGYPRVVLYQVAPNPDGTVRLQVWERPFSGPISTSPFCEPAPTILHAPSEPAPVVLLDRLAYCRFSFQHLNQDNLFGRERAEEWVQPRLPYAVRIELAPAEGSDIRMPFGNITIPLHVSRTPGEFYQNEQ